jgi:hypothetical protein
MPMRWILPGGAVLGERNRRENKSPVVCRPGAAVLESVRPPRLLKQLRQKAKQLLSTVKGLRASFIAFIRQLLSPEQLRYVKLILAVVAVLVGLITALLALFGLSRK